MIGDSSLYKYIDDKTPKDKINYSYSKYGGELFISDYLKSRKGVFIDAPFDSDIFLDEKSQIRTELLFNKWIKRLNEKQGIGKDEFDLLLKRFEVTKKIFEHYDSNLRPIDKTKFYNYRLYVLFSHILCLLYAKDKKIQYLNALLKVNDICISNVVNMDLLGKSTLYQSIYNEMKYIKELRTEIQE